MKRPWLKTIRRAAWAVFVLSAGPSAVAAAAAESTVASEAAGPNNSLFNYSAQTLPMTQLNYSWLHEARTEQKEIRKWDIVTIIVKHQATMISEGEMDRKKKANGDLVLTDWILLKGLHAFPDPQTLGDPRIAGKVDNKMRSEAGLDTRNKIQFTIACHVVDIRPNGNLILEGRHTIENNEETWNYALTGEARPEDVQPNNSVLSENVADVRIKKWESGHVRDGYRRGWLLRWLDMVQPF